jgi:hypothetical protein
VSRTTLRFDQAAIDRHEFDVGIGPRGQPLIAYKADLPAKHPDAGKLHVRRLEEKGWSEPEKIDGDGETIDGDIRVVWHEGRTLISWVQAEDYYGRNSVLSGSFRRMAILDAQTWSSTRWVAREPAERGKGAPVAGTSPGVYVDEHGGVHMAWGMCSYCLVAELNEGTVQAGK